MNEVIGLPRSLQPWHPWLGWFEVSLAQALGDWVRALADLVGSTPDARLRTGGEPDGLGDLHRRGRYEQLLASEWLLADEIPDEFLRRAASAEHLFLAPRHRARREARGVIALFDAGPLQLGAPRLGHLAAWIVLARRAVDLGGQLRWGALQTPGQWHAAESAAALQALLAQRSAQPVDDANVASWRAALEASNLPTADTEVWWIGAGPADPALPAARSIVLRRAENFEQLEERLLTRGTARRALLPLPASRAATALLRGEFGAAPKFRRTETVLDGRLRIALNRAPLFSQSGSHVAVAALEGHALLLAKLGSSRGGDRTVLRRHEWSAARPLVAAGISDGRPMGIAAGSDALHFWQSGLASRSRPPRDVFELPVGTGRLLPVRELGAGLKRRICVIDRTGRLVGFSATRGSPTQEIDQRVLAMASLGPQRLVYALEFGGGLWLREVHADDTTTRLTRRSCVLESALPPVWFALGARPSGRYLAAMAVLQRPDRCDVLALQPDALHGGDDPVLESHSLGSDERVAGVVRHDSEAAPGLLVIDASRRALRLLQGQTREVIYTANARIVQWSVCDSAHRVALLLETRELLVIDTPTRECILRLREGRETYT